MKNVEIQIQKKIQKHKNTKKLAVKAPTLPAPPVLEQWVDNCRDRDNNVKVKKSYTSFVYTTIQCCFSVSQFD